MKLRLNWFSSTIFLIVPLKSQAVHAAEVIITFNHCAPSLSIAGFSPRGLIYPPSSWGKISFTRRIAKRVSPTSPYKSFFNQRLLRLGADTRRSTTVTPQLLPMRLCSPGSFHPLLFPLWACLHLFLSSGSVWPHNDALMPTCYKERGGLTRSGTRLLI